MTINAGRVAEADLQAEAAFPEERLILLSAGHVALPLTVATVGRLSFFDPLAPDWVYRSKKAA